MEIKYSIVILVLIISCSNIREEGVNPNFTSKLYRELWDEFEQLDSCDKIKYLEKIYKPIIMDKKDSLNFKIDSVDQEYFKLDKNDYQNFYYYLFAKVINITGYVPENRYANDSTINNTIGHGFNRRWLQPQVYLDTNHFNEDLKIWKSKIGCP